MITSQKLEWLLSLPSPAIGYDLSALERTGNRLLQLCDLVPSSAFFSAKANRFPAVLEALSSMGFGADVASAEELAACVRTGFRQFVATSPGLGSPAALDVAARGGVVYLDGRSQALGAVESGLDLERHGLRISMPGAYEAFGFTVPEAVSLQQELNVLVRRYHFHDGEVSSLGHLQRKLEHVGQVCKALRVGDIDLGGGFAVLSNNPATLERAFHMIASFAREHAAAVRFEFGKVLVARMGFLVTTVTEIKKRAGTCVAVVDASAFNTGDWESTSVLHAPGSRRCGRLIVVGPTCYEGDCFGSYASAPEPSVGDKLILGPFGAYRTSIGGSLHALPRPREHASRVQ